MVHRHESTIRAALNEFQQLSEEAFDKSDIITSLESHGWVYQGERSSVRIFSRAPEGSASQVNGVPKQENRNLESGRRESLPFFRGEMWIEGSWKVSDIVATIRSFGARAVWDSNFDSLGSAIVEALNFTDTLSHLVTKAAFPVGNRDVCAVTTQAYFSVVTGDEVAYVVNKSVEDGLIPSTRMRSTIHLGGYCVRSSGLPPEFGHSAHEQPPSDRPALQRTASALHKRAKSTVPNSISPPNSGFFFPTTSAVSGMSTNIVHARHSGHSQSHADERNVKTGSSVLSLSTRSEPSKKRGIHLSYIGRSSPGGNLPQTYVDELTVNVPLTLAYISRYLQAHGFAPHIVRSPGLIILQETYDVIGATYSAVYQSKTLSPTRVRFWGSAFGKGKFKVQVGGSTDWTIDYDVPTVEEQVIEQVSDKDPQSGERKGRHRRGSVSIHSHLIMPRGSSSSFRIPSSASFKTQKESIPTVPLAEPDPALLPGPLGGCTILIPSAVHQVTVSIHRLPSRQSQNSNAFKHSSIALGQAAKLVYEGWGIDDIHTFLNMDEDGKARESLRIGEEIKKLFNEATEKEMKEKGQLYSHKRIPVGHTL